MSTEETSKKPLIEWLTCRKELLEFGFTFDEINKALDQIGYTVRDLTDFVDIEHGKTSYFENSEYYELVNNNVVGYFTETKIIKGHEWKREYTASASRFRKSAQYQGLKHEKLVRKLLSNRYDWFSKFDWSIYEVSSREHYEIYMETEFGTLYVPIKALIEKDASLIEKRMLEYWDQYRDGRNLKQENSHYEMNRLKFKNGKYETLKQYNKRQQGYYEKEIKPLQSKEFELLKKVLQ